MMDCPVCGQEGGFQITNQQTINNSTRGNTI